MQPALSPAAATGELQTLVSRAREQDARIEVLTWQLAGVRERLDASQAALAADRRALARAEAESRTLSQRYVELQAQNGNLAKLVIGATLLHAALDEGAVLQAIHEVVINLVGSEEFAVVEPGPFGGGVAALSTFGIDPDRVRALPLSGELERALETGEAEVHDDPAGDHEHPVAIIPLRIGETCEAAVVIYGLLTQKDGWAPFDHELFSLLTTHAGRALYAARLHHRHDA